MMSFLWFVLPMFIGLSTSIEREICKVCACDIANVLDCSTKGLADHFNDTYWADEGQLKLVKFDNNSIAHLKPFPKISIVYLSLRHNFLTKIEDGVFKAITNLTELDLSYNHLTSDELKPNIFQGNYEPTEYLPIATLRVLRLGSNSLHTLHPDIFEHVPDLQELYLDSNPFKAIDQATVVAISSLTMLQVLDLTSTQLKSLPNLMLHSPAHLEVLNISSNYFSDVPLELGQSRALVEVVLDDNPIKEVVDFPAIPTLKILRMNEMEELVSINNGSLGKLVNLQELYCTHNRKLKRISSDALQGEAPKPAEGFTWPTLRKLYLSDNYLEYLDFTFLAQWDELTELDLQRNAWTCDCENQWLVSILIPMIKKNNLGNSDQLICFQPSEMEGKHLSTISEKNSQMRCLDAYGNHPEHDATILIAALIFVLVGIPLIMFAIMFYRRSSMSPFLYSRASYQRTGSLESFS